MMAAAVKDEQGGDEQPRKPWRPPAPAVPRGTPANLYPQRMDRSTAAQLVGMSYWTFARADVPARAIVTHTSRPIYDRDELLAWRPQKKKAD